MVFQIGISILCFRRGSLPIPHPFWFLNRKRLSFSCDIHHWLIIYCFMSISVFFTNTGIWRAAKFMSVFALLGSYTAFKQSGIFRPCLYRHKSLKTSVSRISFQRLLYLVTKIRQSRDTVCGSPWIQFEFWLRIAIKWQQIWLEYWEKPNSRQRESCPWKLSYRLEQEN